MWSKITTEAQNSKRGQASQTARQQALQTLVTVLFLHQIVWIAGAKQYLNFTQQEEARQGRKERKTVTASRNLNLLSFRDSCATLRGQYDSALVK